MEHRPLRSALARLVTAVLVGLVVALGLAALLPTAFAVMIAIAVAETVFALSGVLVLWPLDAERTRSAARRQDLGPVADELLQAVVAVAGLAGIIGLLVMGGTRADPLPAAVALLGVFMSWAALHVVYATRYAFLYYDVDHPGGIDFGSGEQAPSYRDFFYVSFAVGMTYGVTDSGVTSTAMRVVVLRHGILSFVFGTVILATAINLVTSTFSG